MAETKNPIPETESEVTESAVDAPDMQDDESEDTVVVDAMTGEVRTLTDDEIAADKADEERAMEGVPEGHSPELYHDPYGEERLATSKDEFERLLSEFSGDFGHYESIADLFRQICYDERLHKLQSESALAKPRFH